MQKSIKCSIFLYKSRDYASRPGQLGWMFENGRVVSALESLGHGDYLRCELNQVLKRK